MSNEWGRLVSDLDRNEHGRHEGDVDSSSPTGVSEGNPHIKTGQVIGYTISGKRIVMPPRGLRHSFDNWIEVADPCAEAGHPEAVGASSCACGLVLYDDPAPVADNSEALRRRLGDAMTAAATDYLETQPEGPELVDVLVGAVMRVLADSTPAIKEECDGLNDSVQALGTERLDNLSVESSDRGVPEQRSPNAKGLRPNWMGFVDQMLGKPDGGEPVQEGSEVATTFQYVESLNNGLFAISASLCRAHMDELQPAETVAIYEDFYDHDCLACLSEEEE